jgi:hypothetical protein
VFPEVRYKHSPRRIPHIRAGLALLRLRAGFANHTSAHTSRAKGRLQSLCSITFGNWLGTVVTTLHQVWGLVPRKRHCCPIVRRWWVARSSRRFGIPNLYTVAQNVVSTSIFPDAVGDPEFPIGAELCTVVDTDFREFTF